MSEPNLDLNLPLFLGIAERAAYVPDGNTNLSKWNVLGLRNIVLSNLFPLPFPSWHFAVAIPSGALTNPIHLFLVDQEGKELGFVSLSVLSQESEVGNAQAWPESRPLLVAQQGWTLIFVPIGSNEIVVMRPGAVHIRAGSVTGPTIGQLDFVLVDPPPLGLERITAIRSDPSAIKAVRVTYGCRFCAAKARAYVALDRDAKIEAEGWVWYTTLPDEFACECGKTTIQLDTVRRNLHSLLGVTRSSSGNIECVPLYEQSSLTGIRNSFLALLNKRPREEDIQKFLEANPVLLHPFPAVRLFIKPPLLTEYFADFAVVTPQKELLLIEIEKADTRLLKKDGGVAAGLGHAFDQVRSWLLVADEHRLAVLDSLKIDRNEVSTVRGVVIAGRDLGTDSHHLRRLKGQDWGRISLLTYDDLLYALDSLINRMGKI